MMRYSNTFLRSKILLLIPLLAILFTACGSYQQSSYYDNDGIYGDTETVYRNQESYNNSQRNDYKDDTPEVVNNDATLYENYFGQKAQQYEEMLNNSEAVFTDIDSYSSLTLQDSIDIATAINNRYDEGYAGWGDNPQTTSINIYSNNGFGWGWNNWGWNNWAWNWGWNNWGWNNWGWGGFYDPFWGPTWGWGGFYGPGWGWGWNRWGWNNWGWNNWAYNNYWYNGWNRRSFARTNSRRGYYRNSVAGRTGRTAAIDRNGYTRSRNSVDRRAYDRSRSYNRSGVNRRNYSRGYNNSANIGARGRGRTPGAVRSSGRNYRQNSNGGTYRRGSSPSRGDTGYSRSRGNSRSSGSVRSSRGGNRSSGSVRSSRSSSRSSGSVRSSSGGGGRSYGGGGRSGGSRGGRGRN